MTKAINILIIENNILSLGDEQLNIIRSMAPNIVLDVCNKKEKISDKIKDYEVIYGWPHREQLLEAKSLKWLHIGSAGVDGYTEISTYYNSDIVLTNSSGVYGIPIAEHILGMILAFNRNLHIHIRNQEVKKWDKISSTREFYGSTIGIIGLGDIGTEIARRSKALGAKVIAVKRKPALIPKYADELYGEEGIGYLLEQSDYVVLALPNTQATRGIISSSQIKRMKKNAFIVNVGRGSAIDQEALIIALNEGMIAGAGLDVTDPEPLPKDSPLWDMPNVIISSHTSGLSPNIGIRNLEIFKNNLKLYIEKKPLLNMVNLKEGY